MRYLTPTRTHQRARARARSTFAALVALVALLAAPAAAEAVTVSGTAMKDEVGNTWQGCDGSTPNLGLAVAGSYVGSTSCHPTTGAFTFSGVTIPAIGSQLVVWFDDTTAYGALYTSAASTGANIAGLTPTQQRVWFTTEQASATFDTAWIAQWDRSMEFDVPIDDSLGFVEVEPGFEVHVEAPAQLHADRGLVTASVHVESGATLRGGQYVSAGIQVSANGTLGCTAGPGIARPFCLEPGATFVNDSTFFTYSGQDGRFTIEPITVLDLTINGQQSSTGVIGWAPGQTLTMLQNLHIKSPVTSDPWATDIVAGGIYFDGWSQWAGIPVRPRWTGTSSFDITVKWGFTGGGVLDLPAANVTLRSVSGRVDLGPNSSEQADPSWEVGSLTLRNDDYWRYAWGSGGTGQTVATNSPSGSPADTLIAIAESWTGTYALYQLGQNSGDWGIVRYDENGMPDGDWDDGDTNSVNDDGDAILVFNSGGVDVPWDIDVDGSSVVVVGSSGGNWMVRMYDGDGALDTNFNGTGWRSDDFGNATDEARAVVYTPSGIAVAGHGGATLGWRLRVYETNGTVANTLSWNNGGTRAEVRDMCANERWGGPLYIVGSAGAPGSKDWAIKRTSWDWWTWDTFNGTAASSAWTWNPGGTNDEAVACTAEESAYVNVAGTTGTGAADDGRVRVFRQDGTPLSTFGSSGVVSFAGTGDDDVYDIVSEPYGNAVYVAGRDAANGGRGFVRRYDPDGDLDTSWGDSATPGIIHLDATADNEFVSALAVDGESRLHVGVRVASNGGDGAIREYDYAGDLSTTTQRGRTRVLMQSPYTGEASFVATREINVGTGSDPAPIIVDLETTDVRLESRGIFRVNAANGQLRASSSQPLVSHNDLVLNGSFWANQGEVRVESQVFRAEITVGASTQLHDLTIAPGGKMVAFDHTDPIRVNGQLILQGTSCTEPLDVRSTQAGDQWDLDLTGGGTVSAQYVDLLDARALTPVTATNSRNRGNVSGWTTGGCAGTTELAPNGFQVDGEHHGTATTQTPNLSWFNRASTATSSVDVELYSSDPTADTALWRFDGNGTDSAPDGAWPLTPSESPSYTAGRFGQALDAGTGFGGFDAGNLSLTGEYTIDAWVRTTLPGAYEFPDIIYKGNGTGTRINYRLGFQKSTNQLQAELSTGAGSGRADVSVDADFVTDGEWHHIAMVHRGGLLQLFVDGELIASDGTYSSKVPDTMATSTTIGYQLGGAIDDMRIRERAMTPAEIRGFYRTGRRHADLIWDADPSDTTGAPIAYCGPYGSGGATPCAAGFGRYSIAYAGPPLRLDGARYWARSRTRTTTPSWSNWSGYDWFDSMQSMTASVTTGSTVALGGGPLLPGTDAVGTATLEVSTSNAHGYRVYASTPSDLWAMSDGLMGAEHEIPGIGTPGSTTAWAPGSSGYFGMSVLAAGSGKDTTRWGAGTTTGNLAALNWGWGSQTAPLLLHDEASYAASAQQLDVALRANPPANADPGRFTTTVVFTAVPNV